jgi:uncharacterized protein YbaR (Trm112 family)
MANAGEAPPAVRFCPYCGQPMGSFFGNRVEGGAFWCDRCQECFRVENVKEIEGE